MIYDAPRLIVPRLAPWPGEVSMLVRLYVFVEAVLTLIWLDALGMLGFRFVHRAVATTSTATVAVRYDALTLARVAVRDATIFYFKPVHCLQRSAAVTRLLRRRGVPATLVIGYLPMPIHCHAWVELNTQVVWDGHSLIALARVLDRL